MLFNSFEFIFLFFPVVTIIYYLLGYKMKIIWLLAASCFFYMIFVPEYILILVLAILIDYGAGIFIEKSTIQKKKKLWLVLSVVSTCLLLFLFKYYNFFIENFNSLSDFVGSSRHLAYWSLILPIGLSFHTFQSLSYVIEVYRGNVKAEKNFLIYSLYVLFYPQLVAGPIERPQNIIPQLREEKKFNWDNIFFGLRLMTWGMFKKVVIADNISLYADDIFNSPDSQGLTVYLGAFFFTIQIYCDFSGYSDIARGTAKTLGYDLMENFNLPYLATSLKDFWSRWHISLSTWFRDYLYFPLGGNRKTKWRTQINQLLVFSISGFWHGANWNFICWGGLHGFFVGFQNAFFPKSPVSNNGGAIAVYAKRFLVFNFVLICWIYFRASGFFRANDMIKNMVTGLTNISTTLNYVKEHRGLTLVFWFMICLLFLFFDRLITFQIKNSFASYKLKYTVLMSCMISCICLIGFWGKVNFIYFQF